jgi:acetyl-CoA carboxylase alpha subunit
VPEPEGGAHTDPPATLDAVREAIARHLADLQSQFPRTSKGARRLLEARREKYLRIGRFAEVEVAALSGGQDTP